MFSPVRNLRSCLIPCIFVAIASVPLVSYDQHTFFPKPHNDGTVSCNAFCTNTGGYWGPAGICLDGIDNQSSGPANITCDKVLGGGHNVTCECQAPWPAPTGTVEKPGDNGSVSCGAFCTNGGANWGRAGTCVGGRIEQGPGAGGNIANCDDGLGVLGNVVCYCQPPCDPPSSSFEKPNNNGTVSCNTFCSNKGGSWGPVGTCTGGRVEQGLWAGHNIACSTALTDHSPDGGNVVCYCKPSPVYMGCYVDPDGNNRKLPITLSSSSTMTIEDCVVAAMAKGLTYAGLQAGGQCYGGNDYGGQPISTVGTPSPYLAPDQSVCNERCKNDQTEICGGAWVNSVYYTKGDNDTKPGYLGCYQDSSSGRRKLPVTLSSSSTMTVETCLAAARSKNLPYAGLQFGGQCYGGNTLSATDRVNEQTCSMTCNGNQGEVCGGVWLNSVYATGYPLMSCAYDQDFSSDDSNCGSCGHVCGSKSSCQGGKCVLQCGSLTACGNYCVDLTTNRNYCGSCGHSCAPGWECRGSSCYNPCPKGNCGYVPVPPDTGSSCPR